MAAQIHPFLAMILQVWHAVRTRVQLIIQGTEQLLDQGMGVLTVQVVWALVPVPVILHVVALFDKIEVKVWRPPKVLLSMGVVALRPFMLLIYIGTKACFVPVYHELIKTHRLLGLVEVLGELAFVHEVANCGAFFSAER